VRLAQSTAMINHTGFTIGPIHIDFPVTLAALAGYSDAPMRTLARHHGAPYTLTEVILDKFILDLAKGKKMRRYLHPEAHPVGVQLMGINSPTLAEAALRTVELGFDAVELNFACPVPKVVGKQRGGRLMADPELAIEIFSRLRDALPENIPLTAKLRRGFGEEYYGKNGTPREVLPSSAQDENCYRMLDGLYNAGAAAVTLHGRFVRQRYRGNADWNFLTQVREYLDDSLVLLGSGDLFTADACVRMLEQCKVNGVTAARGAIGNPWIFRQARDILEGRPAFKPTRADWAALMREHYELTASEYGEQIACRVFRKFTVRYAMHYEPPCEEITMEMVRTAFSAVETPEQWEEALSRFYD